MDSIYIVPEMNKSNRSNTMLLNSLPPQTTLACKDGLDEERIDSLWNEEPVIGDEESFADAEAMRAKLVRGDEFLRTALNFRRMHFGTRPTGVADATLTFSTQAQPSIIRTSKW